MVQVSASSRRANKRLVSSVVVAFVFLAGVVACTSGESPPTPVRTTVEKIWTAAGVDPVSAVRNIDGVAVVYGTTPNGLQIYGLDAATGAILWSKPAVPGVDADRLWVSKIDDTVAYYRPTETDRLAQLVVADPKTGNELAVSSARYWRYVPWSCVDDPAWVCATSFVQTPGGRWDFLEFRVNKSSGQTQPATETATANQRDDHTMAGGDLYWNSDHDMVTIGRRQDGQSTWSKPVADLFGTGTKSFSSYWYSESSDSSFSIITLAGATGDQAGQGFDMATGIVSAAITLSDGSTRWADQGTALGCLGDHANLGWYTDQESGKPYAFRCRYTGSAVSSDSALDGSQFTTSNLAVALEKFDPVSGTTAWTAELGNARTLAGDTSGGVDEAIVDDTHLLVPNSTGSILIDLQNGRTRPPVDSDVLWCKDTREFNRSEAYYSADSKQVTSARRSGVFRPCKLDGTDSPIPTTAFPASVSTSFGDELRVMALTGSVSGFLAPPGPVPDLTTDSATASKDSTTDDQTVTPAPSASSSELPDSVVQVWATTGFEPFTSVTLVGFTALLYGSVGSDLYLIAVDPMSGTERWRQRASAAGLAPTTKIVVKEIDGAIAYLRPTPALNQNTQLVLADPMTGNDLLVTEARWWTGFPQVCHNNNALLCGWSYATTDNMFSVTATRVERSSGAVSVGSFDDPPTGDLYEPLFDDVVQVRDAPTETIGVLADGNLKWSAAVVDLLGAGGTLSEGWTIGTRPGAPPIIYVSAHLSWAFDPTTGYPALDLNTNQVTVGLNADTGAVIWREPGTWTNCRNLLGNIEQLSTPGSPFPALRCRYSGQLNSVRPGGRDELTVPTDLAVIIERVDLSSGRAIWSIPLGAQATLAADALGLAMTQLDDHRMLLDGQVIDLDTGASRAASPDDVFWCPGRQTFDQSVAYYDRTGSRFDRAAGGVAFPCDAAANPTSAMPGTVPLAVSTVTDGGLRLVSTPAGVVAYRMLL